MQNSIFKDNFFEKKDIGDITLTWQNCVYKLTVNTLLSNQKTCNIYIIIYILPSLDSHKNDLFVFSHSSKNQYMLSYSTSIYAHKSFGPLFNPGSQFEYNSGIEQLFVHTRCVRWFGSGACNPIQISTFEGLLKYGVKWDYTLISF